MLEKMKQSTHAEVDAWLAQGNQITQIEPPKNTHPYRVTRIKQDRKKENAKAKKRRELHFSKIA